MNAAPSITVQRLANWAQGVPNPPVRIELHVTNRCNLRCRFCWQAAADPRAKPSEISHEKALEIVNDAGRIGVKEWIISGGGEPLVRRETIAEVLPLIKKHGMWGQLTTNGVLFTPELINDVVAIGWNQVQFSIDAPDAATHNYLRRGHDAFEKATANLKMLSARKRREHADLPYVGINCVLTNRIHTRLSDMINLAAECGSQLVFFEPVYPGYLTEDKLDIDDHDRSAFAEEIERALETAQRVGVATNIANYRQTTLVDKRNFADVVLGQVGAFSPSFLTAPCFQPWYLMGIKGDGLAGCCSTFSYGEYIHTKTLEEVWYGQVFNQIRTDMIARKLPDYCSKCSVVVVLDNDKFRQELWDVMNKNQDLQPTELTPKADADSLRESEPTPEFATLQAEIERYDAQLAQLEAVLRERKSRLAHYSKAHAAMEKLRASMPYKLYRLIKGF